MKREDFVEYLNGQEDNYGVSVGELDGEHGVFVENRRFETNTHFTWDAIEESELESLLQSTSHGRNIEQITRVTGYFSKAGAGNGKAGWNKGKMGELKDRSRTEVGA